MLQGDFTETADAYLPFIRSVCAAYPQRHRQDLAQEGLIGLYTAYVRFESGRGAAFDAFAKKCVRNRIVSAYRKLGKTDADAPLDEDLSVGRAEDSDPERQAQVRELFKALRGELSELERDVFDLYLSGLSSQQTAQRLDVSRKSVTDAMLRVKRKIRKKIGD